MSEFEEGEKVKFVGEPGDYNRDSAPLNTGEIVTIDECLNDDSYRIEHLYYAKDELQKINDTDMKSFYVEVEGEQHSKLLQEIAFEEGYEWQNKGKDLLSGNNIRYISFNVFEDRVITHNSRNSRANNHLEDPSLEEFRQALRGNYDWEEPIVIDGYEVEFNHNKEWVEVGCETYSYSVIETSYKALNHELGVSNLNIQLHHDKVGEIPFEIIEAIYNRIVD